MARRASSSASRPAAPEHTIEKTGADSADLALDYADGDRCDVALTFRSETSGGATFVCMYDETDTVDWQAVDRP